MFPEPVKKRGKGECEKQVTTNIASFVAGHNPEEIKPLAPTLIIILCASKNVNLGDGETFMTGAGGY